MVARFLVVAAMLILTQSPALADPCADLAKMYTGMVAAISYRLIETSPVGPTRTTEFVAPDRFHIMGGPVDAITTGTRQFSKLAGKWYESESRASHPPTVAQAMKSYIDAGTFSSKVCSLQNPVDISMKDGYHAIQLHDPTYGVDGNRLSAAGLFAGENRNNDPRKNVRKDLHGLEHADNDRRSELVTAQLAFSAKPSHSSG